MMVYKNTKVKVLSPEGDTDYFDIVAGVLQGEILAPYLFIICLSYVLRSSDKMKENGFKQTKEKSRWYAAQKNSDADYADEIALLTSAHSLERTAAGIGLHVNAQDREYICFNQSSDTSTLNRSSLKLVNNFTYLDRHHHATSKGIDSNDRLSITWKSHLTDKIKLSFFQVIVSILLYGCTTLNVWRKTLISTTQEYCEQYWTNHGGSTPQGSNCTTTYHPSRS